MELNSNIKGKSALSRYLFCTKYLVDWWLAIFLALYYVYSSCYRKRLPYFYSGNSILASEKYAWIAVLIVGVWQAVAMNTIIYISGLQTVPEEVYEACMLDGASGWKKFKSITLPLIMPFVTINLVLCIKMR